jgi:hypothetical protein
LFSTEHHSRKHRGDEAAPQDARAIDRVGWFAVGFGALGVLAAARWLDPDPRGFGTHEQLGLPACVFHALTSLPCPTCGLTTSFAHLARLETSSAISAHVLGVPLFLVTLTTVPLSLLGASRGWSLSRSLGRAADLRLVLGLTIALGITWIARLL